jgi:hypothetical protein
MTPRTLISLAGATVAAAALAAFVTAGDGSGPAAAERGRPLFPDLAAEAGEIRRIVITRGAETVTVAREGDRFLDATGFPVKPEAVADLVASLAGLRIEDRRTADPARHAEIGLAEPGAAEGAGVSIRHEGEDERTLASLIAGERDFTVGGVGGGQFVREGDAAQAWLVRGAAMVPPRRAGWFDARLADAPAARLARATLTTRAGEAVSFARRGEALALAAPPPPGLAEDAARVARLARVFETLDFEDVRAAAELPAPGGAMLSAETAEGLRLTLTEDGPSADRWARVSAEALSEAARPAAEAINARTQRFAFRLSTSDSEPLGWTAADFATQPQS